MKGKPEGERYRENALEQEQSLRLSVTDNSRRLTLKQTKRFLVLRTVGQRRSKTCENQCWNAEGSEQRKQQVRNSFKLLARMQGDFRVD